MSTTPQVSIYTVYVFQIRDGKRILNLHYVAGLSSDDAERRIKERHTDHLKGQCFITTDELRDFDTAADCKLYTTRYRNEESISDESHRRWVRAMTRESSHDGERHPAAVRRFHVQPELARRDAVRRDTPADLAQFRADRSASSAADAVREHLGL